MKKLIFVIAFFCFATVANCQVTQKYFDSVMKANKNILDAQASQITQLSKRLQTAESDLAKEKANNGYIDKKSWAYLGYNTLDTFFARPPAAVSDTTLSKRVATLEASTVPQRLTDLETWKNPANQNILDAMEALKKIPKTAFSTSTTTTTTTLQ